MRILKFNEESKEELKKLEEYIKICFIDIIDEYPTTRIDNSYDGGSLFVVIPIDNNEKMIDFYLFQDNVKELVNILSKIDESIDKVRIKYPNIIIKCGHHSLGILVHFKNN